MPAAKFLIKQKAIIKITGTLPDINLRINTDSRKLKHGEVFVALFGDNFDGFDYLEQVLNSGAAGVVYTSKPGRDEKIKKISATYPQIFFVETIDTVKFIQELASLHIQDWKIQKDNSRKIIGITGSNGKTTHKEMLFFLLDTIFPQKVLATKGNLNNHIGVPLTIFELNETHEVAIIEMGMNHPGEIEELCLIAHPEHGIITNIGPAHIEFMHTIANIFQEKKSLYDSVLKNSDGNGMFVVNADDSYLVQLPCSKGLTTFGEKAGNIIIKIEGQKIVFNFLEKKWLITNKNILEHHNLKNLVGTVVLAMKLFPNKTEEIILAANHYSQPSMNRSQWIENIFLDAYNANPASMKVSVDSFVTIMKQKNVPISDCYFVIGDMNELGKFAEELHGEIGQHLKLLGVKNITFLGRYKQFYLKGFGENAKSYLNKEEFYEEWKSVRKNYKYIFVKASRSLQLESLMSIF